MVQAVRKSRRLDSSVPTRSDLFRQSICELEFRVTIRLSINDTFTITLCIQYFYNFNTILWLRIASFDCDLHLQKKNDACIDEKNHHHGIICSSSD